MTPAVGVSRLPNVPEAVAAPDAVYSYIVSPEANSVPCDTATCNFLLFESLVSNLTI